MKKPKTKIIGTISLTSSSNYPIANIPTSLNQNIQKQNNTNIQTDQKENQLINHKRAKSSNKFKYIKNKTNQINLNSIISNIPNKQTQNTNYKTTTTITNKKNYHSLSPQYYRYKNNYLLPPKNSNKKTLVLDLDETLVHSGFIPFDCPSDVIIQIELENEIHDIHVLVRPYVKEFLEAMSKRYELVIFTASISKYANPLLNIIDKKGHCPFRLFREHCTLINTAFVKDLTRLGRDMKDIIIVDNSPVAYALNQYNGFPIQSWFEDKNDTELLKIIPILEFLSYVPDVREYIKKIVSGNKVKFDIVSKVISGYNNKLKNNLMPLSMRFFDNLNCKDNILHKSKSSKLNSFQKYYSDNVSSLNQNNKKLKYKKDKLSITNSNDFFNKNNIFNMNTMRYNSSTKKISFMNKENKNNSTNGNENYISTNVNKNKNGIKKKKPSLDTAALKDLFVQLRKNSKNYSQDKGNTQITSNSKSQRVFTKNKVY